MPNVVSTPFYDDPSLLKFYSFNLLVDMKIKTKCSSGLGMTLFLVNKRKISSPSQRVGAVPDLQNVFPWGLIAGSPGNRALAPVHREKNAAAPHQDKWYEFSKYLANFKMLMS